jgi:hypothetical protein
MMDTELNPGLEDEEPQAAEPKPAGPYQLSDEDLVNEDPHWIKEAAGARTEILAKRKEEWKYLAGDQWAKEDVDAMKRQKRPRLTLNMLLTIMAAVEGEERTNRQEIKTSARGRRMTAPPTASTA